MTTRTPIIDMDDAFKIIGRTHAASNNTTILEYRGAEYGTPEGIKRQFKLTQNNLKEFKELFGEPEFSYQNEYREYVWIVPFEDLTVVIFTGEHGTSYEVRTTDTIAEFQADKSLGESLIRFLKKTADSIPDHSYRK